MANWVTVENNEITGYYDLIPQSWKHISGLDKSKDDTVFLKSLGWFPVARQLVDYDINTHEITSFQYQIQENSVTEIPVITERSVTIVLEPADTIGEFQVLKDKFMATLRAMRNEKLAQSDYTQLADIQATFDDETKNKWTAYRQALRDFPAKYIDNDVLSIENVTWPEV